MSTRRKPRFKRVAGSGKVKSQGKRIDLGFKKKVLFDARVLTKMVGCGKMGAMRFGGYKKRDRSP